MKNFLVYKSSAGSGKTTTLVKEYLKLTLTNPALFKSVLAVTFTNKAANEMKTRILETLRNIISGNFDDYLVKSIVAGTNIDKERLSQNALLLQFNINHHYDDFSVSTIDSFVHKIVRTFAGDLELPQNFEVLIDDDDFVPFIVEDIYKNVGIDKDFTEILTGFVISKVEDEKSHNITGTLTDFVKKQMREEDFFATLALEHMETPDYIGLIEKLKHSYYGYRKKLTALAEEALNTIAAAGLQADDFSGKSKSGVISYFVKAKNLIKVDELAMPGPGVLTSSYNVFENGKDWYTKSAADNVVEKIEGIKPLLTGYYNEIKETARGYVLRWMIFKNIYRVVLVYQIRLLFRDFIERTQKVPISEFNRKIASEIAGQPVPFIYERLGVRYKHFLIDEFQDTSILQWNNMLPLVEESLANSRFNMIVGDAKQAIYRFRGGEVELFTSLPELYGVENNDENYFRRELLKQNFLSKALDVNYRSYAEIVRFNNEFFDVVKNTLSQDFIKIYDNHHQKIPSGGKEGGLISLRFLKSNNAGEYKNRKPLEIVEIIAELLERGYSHGDIAVLCRKNDDATSIAAHLLYNNIPVVSSESVKLAASAKVRFIIALLRFIADGNDDINSADLIYLFLKLQNRTQDYVTAVMNKDISFNGILENYGFEPVDTERMSLLNVYEVCEEIVRHFFNNEPVDAFVRFFLDFVLENRQIHSGDINEFLELWEVKKEKLSITLPENGNAVNILTAHKAKGLKFGVVIIDLENFDNKKVAKEQFWDEPGIDEVAPLNKVVFDINKKLYAVDKGYVYEKETAKTKLDELNLVYVAFTRPVYALYALGNIKEDGKTGVFGGYMKSFLKAKNLWNEDQHIYDFGVLPEPLKRDDGTDGNAVMLTSMLRKSWRENLAVATPGQNPMVSVQNAGEKEYGTMLHEILAEIYSADDVKPVLSAFRTRGLLLDSAAGELEPVINGIVRHPQLKELFVPGLKVKNETELYDAETNSVLRPDRVVFGKNGITVLDYKTGNREKSHLKQIQNYGKIIAQTGHAVHSLLLVYISNDSVDVVNAIR